jgi:hypothetical protein
MTTLEPEPAYLAMFAFLDEHWERAGRPDELGGLLSIMIYKPGLGSADPAMWHDWLAAIRKVQKSVPGAGEPMTAEQAYLAMFAFIEEYWNVVMQPAELGNLLGLMRYTPGQGTADPAMWQHWLDAIKKTRA